MSAELKNTIRDEGLESLGRYYGSYRGIVVSNEDTKFLGRLKVSVPAISGDEAIEEWAWPKGMFAGKDIGFFAVPNPKDAVWVSFENGDPSHPIWEYGWWAENQMPQAANNNNGKPTNKVFQTTSGHRIEVDDKDNDEAIRITEMNGNKITMDKNGIVMEDKFGHKIIMKSGSISLEKNGDAISLGTEGGSAEPAVLGIKNETVLTKIAASLQVIQTAFSSAADSMSVPITALATAAAAIQVPSGGEITQTKSQKVTLD